MQQKEFVFCLQNEQIIINTINELMLFYNYDIENRPNQNVDPSITNGMNEKNI